MPASPSRRPRRIRAGWASALAAAGALAMAGAAGAAPAWTPAASLAPASDFSLAVDRDGKALVLATLGTETASSVADYVHPVSPAGWQAEPIAAQDGWGRFVSPEVQLDDRGVATGTWGYGWSGPGNTSTTVAVRPVGGGWQTMASADDVLFWNTGFHLAVGATGNGVLVSECYFCDTEGGAYAVARSVGPEGVGPGQLLSEKGDAGLPRVALDSAGRATVAWSSPLGVRVASRGLGGAWSAPLTVAPGTDPAVAVSPSGVAELAWVGADGVVRSSRRPGPDAAWQGPVVVSPGAGSSPSHPGIDIAIDSGDKAVLAWTGANGRLRAAVRPAGAAWTAQVVSPAAGSSPQVAVNPAGTAFAVFSGPTGAPLVSIRPSGGAWGAATPLGAAGAGGVQVATDANGNSVAAWISAAGLLQSATYDATGPVVPAPVVPATAVAGQPVTVSMAPWDLWSPVDALAWDFGDGSTATEAHATHVYASPGTYTVTARAADEPGNETTRSAGITVVAPAPKPPPDLPPVDTTGTVGTSGTVGAVTVGIPGGSPATTPRPAPPTTRRAKALRATLVVPRSITAGTHVVLRVRLNRALRGALIRVQLRQGVVYRTIAQGRVSGRRIPVALTFARAGRYLLRVQIRESGRPVVSRVATVLVRR